MYNSSSYAGFLIDFISGPVNAGFTSAVAILIVASQVKDIIGVKAVGATLSDMVVSISKDIHNFQSGDAILGSICVVIILLLRVDSVLVRSLVLVKFYNYFQMIALVNVGPKNESEQTKFQCAINRTMWLIGTLRNSIVIVVTTYIGFVYIEATGHDTASNKMPPIPFKVVGMSVYYYYLYRFLRLEFFEVTASNDYTSGFQTHGASFSL